MIDVTEYVMRAEENGRTFEQWEVEPKPIKSKRTKTIKKLLLLTTLTVGVEAVILTYFPSVLLSLFVLTSNIWITFISTEIMNAEQG